MPLYQGDIEKKLGEEYWTNRYIISAASLALANDQLLSIKAAERTIHKASVEFTKMRVADQDPLTDAYITTSLGQVGLAAVGSSGRLPLFNVVRVDFNVAEGRPSRKYLRLPIVEDEMVDGILTAAFTTSIVNGYSSVLLGLPAYVDVDGQAFSSAAVFNTVAMRQLRRGSKRTQPVLT